MPDKAGHKIPKIARQNVLRRFTTSLYTQIVYWQTSLGIPIWSPSYLVTYLMLNRIRTVKANWNKALKNKQTNKNTIPKGS